MRRPLMIRRSAGGNNGLLTPIYDIRRQIPRLLVRVALPAVLIGVYLFWCWRFWGFTIDDAYISARYARNLAQGLGLVYNPGERVMGFTNLLLTLVEALVYQGGGDGLIAAKVIGLLSGLGVLGLTGLITRSMGGSAGAALLAVAFLAAYPTLPLSAVMGLETVLFTFFVLLALFLMIRHPESVLHPRDLFVLGTVLGLATLTRPEGFEFALVFFILTLIRWRQQRPLSPHRLFLSLASWLSAYAAILIPALAGLGIYLWIAYP